MTLTAYSPNHYNGDGSTTTFAISFVFWDSTDIKVILTDVSGTDTTWVYGTHFSLTGGAGATGSLTVLTSPTDYTPVVGASLTVKSNLPNTQSTSLPLGGPFPTPAVEQRLDKITRQIQQLKEISDRSLQLAESSALSGLEIPAPESGKVLAWNSDEDGLENLTPNAAAYLSVSTFVQTLLDDLTAAAFMTTLGLSANGQSLVTAANYAAMRTALGLVIGTNVQAYDANTAKLNVQQAFSKQQAVTPVALTSSSNSIATDMSLSNNFSHTFTENTTLANPSNPVAGTSGQIAFTQHASAAKTLAYGSQWIEASTGSAPSVSTTVGTQNLLSYYVFDSTHIYYVLNKHGVA